MGLEQAFSSTHTPIPTASRPGETMIQFAALGLLAVLVTVGLGMSLPSPAAGAPPSFGDQKTSWHGFDRYDFLMDEADLSIKPYQAAPDEGTAVKAQVTGQRRCVVVVPKAA